MKGLFYVLIKKRLNSSQKPSTLEFINRLDSAHEFLIEKKRCLFLKDNKPTILRTVRDVKERVESVKTNRISNTPLTSQKLGASPPLFDEIQQPIDLIIGYYRAIHQKKGNTY
jgi:hypothetical protein